MRNRLKVLPLPFIFTKDVKYWQNCVDEQSGKKEIPPRLNRNGWYYDRTAREAWIEVDGRAWLDRRVDDFLYCLEQARHDPLSDAEVLAIKTLMSKRGRCPKALKDLLRVDHDWRALDRIYKDSYKSKKRWRTHIRETHPEMGARLDALRQERAQP